MHMRRGWLWMAAVALPLIALLVSSGCRREVKTYRETERVTESEPRMVSPGEEVIE